MIITHARDASVTTLLVGWGRGIKYYKVYPRTAIVYLIRKNFTNVRISRKKFATPVIIKKKISVRSNTYVYNATYGKFVSNLFPLILQYFAMDMFAL